jgi:hypothetical protein
VLTLSTKLLTTLRAIELKRHLLMNEKDMGLITCVESELRAYLKALPRPFYQDLGLRLNEGCFQALSTFCVPNEWMDAEQDKLDQFSFGFVGCQ